MVLLPGGVLLALKPEGPAGRLKAGHGVSLGDGGEVDTTPFAEGSDIKKRVRADYKQGRRDGIAHEKSALGGSRLEGDSAWAMRALSSVGAELEPRGSPVCHIWLGCSTQRLSTLISVSEI